MFLGNMQNGPTTTANNNNNNTLSTWQEETGKLAQDHPWECSKSNVSLAT